MVTYPTVPTLQVQISYSLSSMTRHNICCKILDCVQSLRTVCGPLGVPSNSRHRSFSSSPIRKDDRHVDRDPFPLSRGYASILHPAPDLGPFNSALLMTCKRAVLESAKGKDICSGSFARLVLLANTIIGQLALHVWTRGKGCVPSSCTHYLDLSGQDAQRLFCVCHSVAPTCRRSSC